MNFEQRYKWACENPSDFAELVPVVKQYALLCDTITEFGVRGAVSTMAWLAAKPKRLTCYDINTPECLQELRGIAVERGTEFNFHKADTRHVHITETDLLFVDTTHNEDTVRAELFNNHSMVSSYIILHDTELFGWNGEGGKGIRFAIMDFLLSYTDWSIAAHHIASCGLTILRRD